MDASFDDSTIALVGVGLIGGSLGLAFKRLGIGKRIVAVSRPETVARAREVGAVDDGAPYEALAETLADADLVFLCTPISRILELLPDVIAAVPEGAIVTDVGSTKRAIVDAAGQCGRDGVHFVGGHPMAGSEFKGVDAADAFLFENAIYAVTPGPDVPETVTGRFTELVDRLGARSLRMAPDVHDRVAAAISHLPQMMATSLVGMVGRLNEEDGLPLQMAAGGFRDLTRIASSPYDMWRDICATNAGPIRDLIDGYIEALSAIRDRVEDAALEEDFAFANAVRGSIPKDSKGFLRALNEVLVEVEDRPGVIAEVGTALHEKGINIKDIEVLKVREGEGGTMRLGFGKAEEADAAVKVMAGIGFRARVRH